ncbi:uncharacterized protein K02A2.6-like [Acipenser ruthenus]|uniref:uncharacterized protein K02A2.6-like n=1 Tax=Acipenser ruthenus TaxID=7906 RepID=UPI002740A12D|nr:uncharacterized protein K02A2.6-like [Acipenser ruthenus]
MDTLLARIPGVKPYLDDIHVSGRTQTEHDERLQEVLQRFAHAGLRLQKEKCYFAVKQVEFLGFCVDQHGIHPTNEKVRAIQDAPIPRNKTELQAFLGLLNFYNCFLCNKATILEPLHRLLDQSVKWEWKAKHEEAYVKAKQLLQADDILAHYDEKKSLVLVCDASPYGVGALLAHTVPEGKEAPISFASRTLTPTERNYAQIDKEALAVVFAVKKFHQYLFGHHEMIYTDHKPLLGLLHHTKPIPQVLSPCMLRWSLILGAYDYELCYRPGKQLANADALSRLPLNTAESEVPPPLEVLLLEMVPEAPLHATQIATLTVKDPVLSRVLHWILHGWPEDCQENNFAPFIRCRNELSAHKNCVLWGSRVVIPERAREEVLTMLHPAHPGIVHMKALARSYVWWPGLDAQVEEVVKSCATCQETRHAPLKAPLHPWEWTANPWSRLHIDFAGPFQGKTFLIVVDSHCKWLEVKMMSSVSSSAVIGRLRQLFATHGQPDVLVPDNGTAFTSAEFKEFVQRNPIRHLTVAPYHPSSNGQAEHMVQTTREALKRISVGDWPTRLARFLLAQHTTPHSTTGKSPAELLMNRKLKTALDRLHPDLYTDMQHKQDGAARQSLGCLRSFHPQDDVHMRNYSAGPKWIPATIGGVTGPVSYKAQTRDGQIHRRHVDQLRDRTPVAVVSSPQTQAVPEPSSQESQAMQEPLPVTGLNPIMPSPTEDVGSPPISQPTKPFQIDVPDYPATPAVRPRRRHMLPKRLEDYVNWGEGV